MYHVDVHDFGQWREHSRALLQRKILPENISWNASESSQSLFSVNSETLDNKAIISKNISIPKAFIPLAQHVACYRDTGRWALLYRVAWRLIYENKQLLNDSIDPDIMRINSMRKSINRDKHKMAAFVRFQKVNCINDDEDYFVAWFEPEHLIVPIKISFFVKRFTNMRWSILTPDMCAHWDMQTLQLTPGVKRPDNFNDELEQLWLEYYKNIFNPARLKTKAMLSEMPKKYWHNLPEAALIKDLTRNAQATMESMIDVSDYQVSEKNQQSLFIQEKQISLRLARKYSTDSIDKE